jgi:hypothetical protein
MGNGLEAVHGELAKFGTYMENRLLPIPDSLFPIPGTLSIHRIFPALRGDFLAHVGDQLVVAWRVEHVGHPAGKINAILLAVAARGHRRRADTQT